MSEETRKFLEEQFSTIQKRLDSLEIEMKALKNIAKSTESKVDNLQKAVHELEGNFELIEADIANAEASIMDTIDECARS